MKINLRTIKKIYLSLYKKIYISKKILKEEGFRTLLTKIKNKFLLYLEYFIIDRKINEKFNQIDIKIKNYDKVLIIISGIKYDSNSGGQRTIYLTNYFNKKGYFILFVFFTWNRSEEKNFGFIKDSIFLIPLRIFFKNINFLLNKFANISKKLLIIEAPFNECFEILSYIRSYDFITIYDIKDDWEEFNKVNQAPWYSKTIEEYVCRNSDLIITVSPGLAKKFEYFNPHIIKNGFDPDSFDLNIKPINIKKGKINIGYFGHLTDSWFDWDFVIDIAKKNSEYIFHIIGYGMPDKLKIPTNIVIYGKINHRLLPSYVKDWDIAIVPFKNSILSENSDPLKIYEYLYLQKPIIVKGICHLKNHPYVFICNNSDEFMKLIKDIKKINIDILKLNNFLKECTWEKRFEIIELLIQNIIERKKNYLITQWSFRWIK